MLKMHIVSLSLSVVYCLVGWDGMGGICVDVMGISLDSSNDALSRRWDGCLNELCPGGPYLHEFAGDTSHSKTSLSVVRNLLTINYARGYLHGWTGDTCDCMLRSWRWDIYLDVPCLMILAPIYRRCNRLFFLQSGGRLGLIDVLVDVFVVICCFRSEHKVHLHIHVSTWPQDDKIRS